MDNNEEQRSARSKRKFRRSDASTDPAVSILRSLLHGMDLTISDVRIANLLKKFGSVGGLFAAGVDRLSDEFGERAANHLIRIHNVIQYTLYERIQDRQIISAWMELERYLLINMRNDNRERLRVLFLDSGNGLIKDEVMQEGSVNHVIAYPREIARRALEVHAAAIIMAHNHPSGRLMPSKSDIEVTQQVTAALGTLGIVMHDHAIVGRNKVLSMRQLGLI